MEKILEKLYKVPNRAFSSHLANLKRFSIEDNHYIFADPRGGSTWLMEIIESITNEPMVWEPLHQGLKGNPFKEIDFGWRQHIPDDGEWPEAKSLFSNIFKGNKLSYEMLKHTSLLELARSESLLFKICRGSALLPWLVKNFEFRFKPIYLIRHPFAVVSSQLRYGPWGYNFEKYSVPKRQFNDYFKKHETFLGQIKTKEEALVAEWCLANYEPLFHEDNNKEWITINYEEFVVRPRETMERVLSEWGVSFNLEKIDFNKNSMTTKNDSPESTRERLSSWQKSLSEEQQLKMGKVLDYFEMGDIYKKDSPFPVKVFNYG